MRGKGWQLSWPMPFTSNFTQNLHNKVFLYVQSLMLQIAVLGDFVHKICI
ncbi:hypothetical protein DET48_12850 [Vibrio diazotrophicus]|uniref:Uncharacterized protein n=1 Tax=Vibrio diazotrophicus TaxID=685 RepID=A0A329E609_VIBDI|nr:hypothetical protein DET48_12850 [Vibrio diazotrophicus]